MLGTFRRAANPSGFTKPETAAVLTGTGAANAEGRLSSCDVALLTERDLSESSPADPLPEVDNDASWREDWSNAGEVDFAFCSGIQKKCPLNTWLIN